MRWEQLKKLNKQIYEATRAVEKFGTNHPSNAELKRLKAEKASLPPEILKQEKINIANQSLEATVKRYKKFPDIAINRQDIIKYRDELRELNIPEGEIQAMIGDALDIKPIEQNKLSKEELELKLQQLKTHIKSYMDDLEFKASLDPNYVMPSDIVAEIETWENQDGDVNFSTIQTKILRAKRNLQSAGVSVEVINIAIRNP